jgi:hypothetical protein
MKGSGWTIIVLFNAFLITVVSCTREYAPEYSNNQETEEDYIWNTADETVISLEGSSATVVSGEGAVISGGEVRIISGGSYRFSGTLSDGRIVVASDGEETVRLILDGVTINNSSSSPIFVSDAAKAVIYLAEGSENLLTDGSSYIFDDTAREEPDAAIYCKSYLGIAGSGMLDVTGRFRDGIVGKDGLVIKSGQIRVNAADDGIRGKDYLLIHNAMIEVNSGDDGLKSDSRIEMDDGALIISAGDDAVHSDTTLIINGGTIDITGSYEGLEAISVTVNGGNIHVVSSDDGINAADGSGGGTMPGMPGAPPPGGLSSGNCTFKLTGGYIWVSATGDGIDINGSVDMTGGTLIIDGPTANNNGAIDYDGTFKVSGGTVVGIGSTGMAQAPGTDSSLCSVLVSFAAQQAAGTLVTITDSEGTVILSAKNSKKFQSVVYCSALVVNGTTYDVYLGGSNSGELVDGVYYEGLYTPGTLYKSFTVSGIVTRVR